MAEPLIRTNLAEQKDVDYSALVCCEESVFLNYRTHNRQKDIYVIRELGIIFFNLPNSNNFNV